MFSGGKTVPLNSDGFIRGDRTKRFPGTLDFHPINAIPMEFELISEKKTKITIVKGLGQRYPNKNGHFGNDENRKIVENALEMTIDESVTVLVDLYRNPRHPATSYDNQSTSRAHILTL